MSTQSDSSRAIPAWLLEKNRMTPAPPHRFAGTHFLTKTLGSFTEVFRNEFISEHYAAAPALLQGIDPRVKLLLIIAMTVLAGFTSGLTVLAALGVIALLYAKLSGLTVKDYLRRAWAYLPAAVLIFSLPGASSLFITGSPLFYMVQPGSLGFAHGLYFTLGGLATAVRLALRCGISLSFAFLLLQTTRWSQITAALAALHVPGLFISILNMTYRYIFVMAAMAGDMMQARYLRSVGKLGAADNRRFMSRSAAHLFIKSHFMSEEIYDAMVCRGFTGKPVSMRLFRLQGADILFLLNNAVILLALIAGSRLLP